MMFSTEDLNEPLGIRPRILVIDDNNKILRLIQDMNFSLAHDVIAARTIQEGIMLFMLWRPVEVILMNEDIFNQGGFDWMAKALQHLQNEAEDRETAIMAISQNCTIDVDWIRRAINTYRDERSSTSKPYSHAHHNPFKVIKHEEKRKHSFTARRTPARLGSLRGRLNP
ncbi:MAG: response regulator [Magnetococcales bacterium]|nr:response regulator [Magnetococcales bacterium]